MENARATVASSALGIDLQFLAASRSSAAINETLWNISPGVRHEKCKVQVMRCRYGGGGPVPIRPPSPLSSPYGGTEVQRLKKVSLVRTVKSQCQPYGVNIASLLSWREMAAGVGPGGLGRGCRRVPANASRSGYYSSGEYSDVIEDAAVAKSGMATGLDCDLDSDQTYIPFAPSLSHSVRSF